jgi:hypothetical protein
MYDLVARHKFSYFDDNCYALRACIRKTKCIAAAAFYLALSPLNAYNI